MFSLPHWRIGDLISHNRSRFANSALGSSEVPELQDSPGRQPFQASDTTKRNCVLRSSASRDPLDHEWPILLTCRFWPNLNTHAWIPMTRTIVNIGSRASQRTDKNSSCRKLTIVDGNKHGLAGHGAIPKRKRKRRHPVVVSAYPANLIFPKTGHRPSVACLRNRTAARTGQSAARRDCRPGLRCSAHPSGQSPREAVRSCRECSLPKAPTRSRRNCGD